MKFFCIGDEDTVRGFRLAGIAGKTATNAVEAAEALAQAVIRPDYGVVILTEKVAAWIRAQVETIRLERDQPLLVEIPGPEGPSAGHKGLGRLVQEAIGISIAPGEGA